MAERKKRSQYEDESGSTGFTPSNELIPKDKPAGKVVEEKFYMENEINDKNESVKNKLTITKNGSQYEEVSGSTSSNKLIAKDDGSNGEVVEEKFNLEAEPSEELSKQSKPGIWSRLFGNEESEKTEPLKETSKPTSSVQRTSNEEPEETEPSEQSSSGQEIPIGIEKSEKSKPSEDNLSQSSSGQRTASEKSNGKVSNF